MDTKLEALFRQLAKNLSGEVVEGVKLDLSALVAYLQAVKCQEVRYKDLEIAFFPVSRKPPLAKAVFTSVTHPRAQRAYLAPCHVCKKPVFRKTFRTFSPSYIEKTFSCKVCQTAARKRRVQFKRLIFRDEWNRLSHRWLVKIIAEAKTIPEYLLSKDIFTHAWYLRMMRYELDFSTHALRYRLREEIKWKAWQYMPTQWRTYFYHTHLPADLAMRLQRHALHYKDRVLDWLEQTEPKRYRGINGVRQFLDDFENSQSKRMYEYENYLFLRKMKRSFLHMHRSLEQAQHAVHAAAWEYKRYLTWPKLTRSNVKNVTDLLNRYVRYQSMKKPRIKKESLGV